jgi:hypothetical protein
MGHFALTVQAGILLGRALRNVRDSTNLSQNSLLDLQNDEAVVLRQAISALAHVASEESRLRGTGICSLTKICYR